MRRVGRDLLNLVLMLLPALAIAILIALGLAACQTVPVDRPCGVIRDDLRTVQGKTPADQQRIDVHHARGKAAGCW